MVIKKASVNTESGHVEDLVSVIVPAYNAAKYLPKCLDSIVNQTYTNLEIIVVNDGSTDNTLLLAQAYSKKDGRLRVINNEHQGVSAARNSGIRESRGTFVSFVDADDWIHPLMIRSLHLLSTKYNADLSVCGIIRAKDEQKKADYRHVKENIYTREEYLKKFFKIGSQETIYHCYSKLYKRKLLDNNVFPKYDIGEDVISTFKAINKSYIIATTSKPLYYYRQGSGITTKFNDKYFQLAQVWDEVVDLTYNEIGRSHEWAIINRARINFTLLTQLALAKTITEEHYSEKKQQLLSELKRDRKLLLSADIDYLRKIGIQLYCIDYDFAAMLVRKLIKRQQ